MLYPESNRYERNEWSHVDEEWFLRRNLYEWSGIWCTRSFLLEVHKCFYKLRQFLARINGWHIVSTLPKWRTQQYMEQQCWFDWCQSRGSSSVYGRMLALSSLSNAQMIVNAIWPNWTNWTSIHRVGSLIWNRHAVCSGGNPGNDQPTYWRMLGTPYIWLTTSMTRRVCLLIKKDHTSLWIGMRQRMNIFMYELLVTN